MHLAGGMPFHQLLPLQLLKDYFNYLFEVTVEPDVELMYFPRWITHLTYSHSTSPITVDNVIINQKAVDAF